MSENTPSPLPPYLQVAHGDDPVPPELLGAPPIRCDLDGTRLWSIGDARAHDEHFHVSKAVEVVRLEPDEGMLRREALDAAVRSQRGPETGAELVARAEDLLGFLRGAAASRESQEEAAWKASGQ